MNEQLNHKESVRHWLALKTVPGVGNLLFLHLVKHFGGPEEVLGASKAELLKAEGVSPRVASAIASHRVPKKVEKDLALVRDNGYAIVTFADADYPTLLRHIHDPPPVLYVYGRLRPNSLNIAIVGSRNATPYGRRVTERMGADLAQRGFTVVSGMARGIDSAAHAGALAADGETIAVLGCGLGTIYPSENKTLFHKIASSGAVISEFPFITPPEAHNFPTRNRIISGLSVGAVIVEATHRSGSLITAKLAAEQGREVFAVPGSITSFKSMGTHRLIKEGAKLVENVSDIVEELNVDQTRPPGQPSDIPPDIRLTQEETIVLNELNPYPIHIDKLVRQVSLSAAAVSSLLLQLELKGLITQSPGKLFARPEA